MSDAAWIAQLVEHGLVRPSFVPPPPIRQLRDLTRYEHHAFLCQVILDRIDAATATLTAKIETELAPGRRQSSGWPPSPGSVPAWPKCSSPKPAAT